jgi:hypothetical protein
MGVPDSRSCKRLYGIMPILFFKRGGKELGLPAGHSAVGTIGVWEGAGFNVCGATLCDVCQAMQRNV